MGIIDKNLVKNQFNKGLKSYANEAIVQKQIAQKLIDELCALCKKPLSHIFEVGSGTGFLTQHIIENLQFDTLFVNDIAKNSMATILELEKMYNKSLPFIEGDAEKIEFPNNLDAVISGSTIQWFKNIPAFFNKVTQSLNTEGLFAFSTFGCDNFKEIKALTEIGLDYLSTDEICTLLSNEYNILLSKEWTEEKEFNTPTEVLQHMKQTGVNGIRKKPFGKKQLNEFTKSYSELFVNENKKVTLTYNPILIIATKK